MSAGEPRAIDLPGERSAPRRGLWIFAATIALSLHAGFAAFALASLREQPDDDDLGAPGIEVALDLASPQDQPSDLPPGPDSDASVASPAMVEQKTPVDPQELPKETPVEAENPDQLVTTQAVKPPKEEEPDVKTAPTAPSAESVPQEATAAPTIENAPEAAKAVTRDPGTAASRQRVRLTWERELLAHLNRYKRYPANRTHKNAEIAVNLELDRMGRVVSASIAKSSGDSAFDDAALAMVHRANPLPAPPPLVADEGLTFGLPVVFGTGGKSARR